MNNNSVNMYLEFTGKTLKKNYEYFHFNDLFSSFLTLFVLLNGHNWVYVTEHLFFIRNSFVTTAFIVSFNILMTFTCCSLILGLICRLLILYFESDFDNIKNKIENNISDDEIVS